MAQHAKGGVKNASWADLAKKHKMAYENQLDEITKKLVERDELLERPFSDEVLLLDPPLEYGIWKRVYTRRMDGLHRTLQDSVILVTSPQPLVSAPLPDKWLDFEAMHAHEKDYWVQKDVVDAIAELNAEEKVVPVFRSFVFTGTAERGMHSSHGVEFECIPFEISVAMEFDRVPELVEALLNSELGLEVTSLSMSALTGGSFESAARTYGATAPTTGTRTSRSTQPSRSTGGRLTRRDRESEDEAEDRALSSQMGGRGLVRPSWETSTTQPTGPMTPRRSQPPSRSGSVVGPTRREREGEEDAAERGETYVPRSPGVTRFTPTLSPAEGSTFTLIPPSLRTPAQAPATPRELLVGPPGLADVDIWRQEPAEDEAETVPPNMVNVIVRGYVPDYWQPEEEDVEDEGEVAKTRE